MSSTKRWIFLSYALLSLIALYVVHQVVGGVLSVANVQDPIEGLTAGVVSLSTILGLLLGGATFAVLAKHPRVNEFADDVAKEIIKVSWPTFLETRAATLVVIVMVAIMAVILGLFDYIFSSLTNLIYS